VDDERHARQSAGFESPHAAEPILGKHDIGLGLLDRRQIPEGIFAGPAAIRSQPPAGGAGQPAGKAA